ncbi:MAG TPA: SPASM domain-containing protein [Bellilinea sp.]|nr:SPASM domain-containing protein [Bellilinea sp.]
MPIINWVQEIVMDLTREMLVHAAPLLSRASPLRHAVIWAREKYIHLARNGDSTNTPIPPGVVADRAEFGDAILHTADHMLACGLSPTVIRRLADNLIRGIASEGGGQSAISRFFEAQGALYGWIFHYMPIGRSFTLDLMPTSEQRAWMWQRVWQIIRERHTFLADFWNHASLSFGCIAGGHTRGGGYLYIDWNGAVSPCVFVPYSPVNVKELYVRGGTLDDVWADPFFADIRNWQEGYWQGRGNWLAPCIIRDDHADLRRLIAQHEPEPADESARQALLDPQYARGLEEYDERYQTLTEPLWKERYLRDGKR